MILRNHTGAIINRLGFHKFATTLCLLPAPASTLTTALPQTFRDPISFSASGTFSRPLYSFPNLVGLNTPFSIISYSLCHITALSSGYRLDISPYRCYKARCLSVEAPHTEGARSITYVSYYLRLFEQNAVHLHFLHVTLPPSKANYQDTPPMC